ncbi:MAG: serine O-acetyltransferase [Akkermansia sp.]|jgi:serine O-acetyltransferase|nr:serine O-acetyltransferase [Akkermansia sp.]
MLIRPEKMIPGVSGLAADVWQELYSVAEEASRREPKLMGILDDVVLSRTGLGNAVAVRLARKLSRRDMGRDELEPLIRTILKANPQTVECMAADLRAVVERDAACHNALEPLLFFKGFHALATYRVAHLLWQEGRHLLALLFQSISSEVFGVDIHPAAQIGCGILLDHGTGFVVGETAIIENDVSLLHEVTLGGTGKEKGGARHPIVRSGVLIGAGAKVLGRVEIGECAKVAASSVVLSDVRPHTTVAGVPAQEVAAASPDEISPALCMQQSIDSES